MALYPKYFSWLRLSPLAVRVTAACGLIAGLVILAYANSFQGVFVFDDLEQIVDNEKVHSLSWPWNFWLNTRRPIFLLSLAFNYAWSGTDVWGYHLVNLVVHLCAALFLFGSVYQASRLIRPVLSVDKAMGLATVCAAVWATHPLLTQSVTYLTQRVESLMGMFFLAAFFCSLRFFKMKTNPWAWSAGLFALLSGMTKEVAAVLPLVVLLFDRVFLSRSFKEAFSRHRILYSCLAVTWLGLTLLYLTTNPEEGWAPTAGFFYGGTTSWHYALTETAVVLHYIRLAFWPAPLVFDYEWKFVQSARDVIPQVIAILVLLAAVVRSFCRWPVAGFLGASFFVILSPTSSFIPIEDPAFEQRMYLPLACLVILAVWGAHELLQRFVRNERVRRTVAVNFVVLLVGALVFLTHQRNQLYQNEITMWQDVVNQRPSNARANNNLGKYLNQAGRSGEAIVFLERAITLRGNYAEAHNNLGVALVAVGRFDEALAHYQKAIQFKPSYAAAYNNIAVVLILQDRFSEAVLYLRQALALKPRYPKALNNYGYAYLRLGKKEEARRFFEAALRLDPNYPEAQRNLGLVFTSP